MKPLGSTSSLLGRPLCVLLVLPLLLQVADTSSSRGTEFVVLMQEANAQGNNSLYAATESEDVATVNVTSGVKVNITTTVSRSSPAWILLPAVLRMNISGVSSNFTILVTASRPISLFAEFAWRIAGGSTLVLPTAELGRRYVVATYIPAHTAQAAVVATRENTTVNLYRNGVPLDPSPIVLQRLEAFQTQSDQDLMGMEVVADKPVAVFSGNVRATTSHVHNTYDPLYSQMVPTISWGTSFITFPTLTSGTNDTDKYRIVASEANTTVHVTGETSISLIKPTDWFQVNLSAHGVFAITSDRPVMVVKYVSSVNILSQPCMTSLVPNDRWLTSYAYRTPSQSSFMANTEIWIVADSELSGFIRVQDASDNTTMPFDCNHHVTDEDRRHFDVCLLAIGPDVALLLTSEPPVTFGAYSFSYGYRVAICHALGQGLTRDSFSDEEEPTSSSLETQENTLAVASGQWTSSLIATTPTATSTSSISTTAVSTATSFQSSAAASLQSSTATSLQSSTPSTSSSSCFCTRRCNFQVTPTNTELALSSAIEQIKSELVVDHREISAGRRKVTSASDRRMTSQIVGYVSIGFITLVLSLVVLPDLLSVVNYIFQAVKRRLC